MFPNLKRINCFHAPETLEPCFLNMHILLVEDDVVNQKIAQQILTKWGIRMSVASDGNEALDLLNSTIFDLVLMDLNMPFMDGMEATKCIRSGNHMTSKHVPILAYTASTLADSKQKAEELGMNDFVSKPLDPEEMHCKINHYILSSRVSTRPLNIKFELYSDSDADFKLELVELMINNLRELQRSFYRAFYSSDPTIFQRICHKVKSTLTLLDDEEFMHTVERLKNALTNGENTTMLAAKALDFNLITESFCKTLHMEVSFLKAAS